MGTRNCTPSALRIRCKDKATTCWHQNISLFPQPHLTDVILHLKKILHKEIETHFSEIENLVSRL